MVNPLCIHVMNYEIMPLELNVVRFWKGLGRKDWWLLKTFNCTPWTPHDEHQASRSAAKRSDQTSESCRHTNFLRRNWFSKYSTWRRSRCYSTLWWTNDSYSRFEIVQLHRSSIGRLKSWYSRNDSRWSFFQICGTLVDLIRVQLHPDGPFLMDHTM